MKNFFCRWTWLCSISCLSYVFWQPDLVFHTDTLAIRSPFSHWQYTLEADVVVSPSCVGSRPWLSLSACLSQISRPGKYVCTWMVLAVSGISYSQDQYSSMDCARQIIHEIWRISPIPNLTEILQHDLDLWIWTTIVKIYGPWGHKSFLSGCTAVGSSGSLPRISSSRQPAVTNASLMRLNPSGVLVFHRRVLVFHVTDAYLFRSTMKSPWVIQTYNRVYTLLFSELTCAAHWFIWTIDTL
jgi:hypothetical protein